MVTTLTLTCAEHPWLNGVEYWRVVVSPLDDQLPPEEPDSAGYEIETTTPDFAADFVRRWWRSCKPCLMLNGLTPAQEELFLSILLGSRGRERLS